MRKGQCFCEMFKQEQVQNTTSISTTLIMRKVLVQCSPNIMEPMSIGTWETVANILWVRREQCSRKLTKPLC